MAETKIEWATQTWNPTTGCSRVSAGCDHCYAMHMARRFDGQHKGYDGTTRRGKNGTDWTGVVLEHTARLGEPFKWRKPERVFVDSMSDLFHPTVSEEFLDAVFGVMGLASRHTFMILTKRPERMRDYVLGLRERSAGRFFLPALFENAACQMRKLGLPELTVGKFFAAANRHAGMDVFPLKNVWLGTSVEDQEAADKRIWPLVETPAVVRFLSCEPLLGSVSLKPWTTGEWKCPKCRYRLQKRLLSASDMSVFIDDSLEVEHCPNDGAQLIPSCDLHWVITGGESGPGARPADPDWFRTIRDDCKAAGISYFHKQNGEWLRCGPEFEDEGMLGGKAVHHPFGTHIRTSTAVYTEDGKDQRKLGEGVYMERVGKKQAGRLLDGYEYDEFPEVVR